MEAGGVATLRATTLAIDDLPAPAHLQVDFFMVVELSKVQIEDVENSHSGPTTASTTNSTFNYARHIAEKYDEHETNFAQISHRLLFSYGPFNACHFCASRSGNSQWLL